MAGSCTAPVTACDSHANTNELTRHPQRHVTSGNINQQLVNLSQFICVVQPPTKRGSTLSYQPPSNDDYTSYFASQPPNYQPPSAPPSYAPVPPIPPQKKRSRGRIGCLRSSASP